jgi:hypothetical protein
VCSLLQHAFLRLDPRNAKVQTHRAGISASLSGIYLPVAETAPLRSSLLAVVIAAINLFTEDRKITLRRFQLGLFCWPRLNSLPIVARGMQRFVSKLRRCPFAALHCWVSDLRNFGVSLAACADHKLTCASLCVEIAPRILRSEAFIIVVVSVPHDIGICSIERIPQRFDLRIVAVCGA